MHICTTVGQLLTKIPSDPSKISQGGSPEDDTTITKRGFEFLLRNIEAQIWSLLLQYLRLAEVGPLDIFKVNTNNHFQGFLKLDSIDVLNFILQIESMEIYQVPLESYNLKKTIKLISSRVLLYLNSHELSEGCTGGSQASGVIL